MDTFNDPDTQRIVAMTSSQVGKTEIILNLIAYYIDQDASPMMCVQPTLAMAQAFSKDRLSSMIRDTEQIRNCIKTQSRSSGDTVLHKKFNGGHLTLIGSNSPSGLASRPIRCLFLDEIDRYETSAGNEGSPIALAIARTKTFWNRKIYLCSTPTIKGLSVIEAAFEESDMRYYNVPCPECNVKQILKWKNVVWEENKPETAAYVCNDCGSVIEESKKQWMITNGEWIATAPKTDTAGFHISELYSVWSTWADMAKNFLEAKKNPETLKTFINTSLAESWEEKGDTVDYEILLQRRLNFDINNIPEDVYIITTGTDCQKDRIEITICGWGKDYKCYVLDHRIIWGDCNSHAIWDEFDDLLKTRFKTESGRVMPISSSTVDSGYHTNQVYAFTKPRQARRIFAVKGLSTAGKPIISRPTFVGKNKAVLYGVGSDTAKEAIFGRLSASTEETTIFFSNTLDEEYMKQITAEKRVAKFLRGRKTLIWKQIRDRNEGLDCLVYNFAAIYILNPNWNLIEQKILVGKNPVENKEETNPLIRTKRTKDDNFANSWKNL